jgi:hypothetical protein
MISRFAFLSLVVFATAGCSQEVPVAPPAKLQAPAAEQVAPAATVDPTPGLVSVRVHDISCSGDPVGVATLTWDLHEAQVTSVAIYVESPGNARKLWMEVGATGTATTDRWVFPDTVFTLVGKDSGKELASQRVDEVRCP